MPHILHVFLVLVTGNRNLTQLAFNNRILLFDITGKTTSLWTLRIAEHRSSNDVFSVLTFIISFLILLFSLSSGLSVLASLLGRIIGCHGKDGW